jgi:hypothetical protein
MINFLSILLHFNYVREFFVLSKYTLTYLGAKLPDILNILSNSSEKYIHVYVHLERDRSREKRVLKTN